MRRVIFLLLICISAIRISAQIEIFGEHLPIEKQHIEVKLTHILTKLIECNITPETLLKKAEILFPYFDKVANKYGVPTDFKYLAVIESNLNPMAASGVGAKGLWQIMPNTGKELGLVINERIDERRSIEKSTHAAMLYLKRNKRYFNSWTLTAASYNCGAGCIQKSLSKSKDKSFYHIKLNKETTEYIYKIAGCKLLFEDYMYKNKSEKKKLSQKITNQLPIENIQLEVKVDSVEKINEPMPAAKKREIVSKIIVRTLSETILTDSTGEIALRLYREDGTTKSLLAPYTIDYELKRAFIRVNGIDIEDKYASAYGTIYDVDYEDGINIVDYTIKKKIIIPKNIKSLMTIYEYR